MATTRHQRDVSCMAVMSGGGTQCRLITMTSAATTSRNQGTVASRLDDWPPSRRPK